MCIVYTVHIPQQNLPEMSHDNCESVVLLLQRYIWRGGGQMEREGEK